jgi:hypothetical protein
MRKKVLLVFNELVCRKAEKCRETEWECNACTSAKPDKLYLYVSFIGTDGAVGADVARMGSCLSAITFRSPKHNESDCLPKAKPETP